MSRRRSLSSSCVASFAGGTSAFTGWQGSAGRVRVRATVNVDDGAPSLFRRAALGQCLPLPRGQAFDILVHLCSSNLVVAHGSKAARGRTGTVQEQIVIKCRKIDFPLCRAPRLPGRSGSPHRSSRADSAGSRHSSAACPCSSPEAPFVHGFATACRVQRRETALMAGMIRAEKVGGRRRALRLG